MKPVDLNRTKGDLPPLPLSLKKQRAVKRAIFIFGFIVIAASFYVSGVFSLARWMEAFSGMLSLAGEAFPPATGAVVPKLLNGALESVIMAISASVISFIFALPLSFLASTKTSPHRLVVAGMRLFFGAIRSIPELIMAILFVAAIGFGLLPGVMALIVISIGMLGRFFYEAIERAHPGPIEMVKVSGVNKLVVIIYGIMPQILTQVFDYSIYRFECNLRASTYIGIVGAGGIGFQVILSLRLMQYHDLLTGIIAIFVLIVSFELLAKFLRQKLLHYRIN